MTERTASLILVLAKAPTPTPSIGLGWRVWPQDVRRLLARQRRTSFLLGATECPIPPVRFLIGCHLKHHPSNPTTLGRTRPNRFVLSGTPFPTQPGLLIDDSPMIWEQQNSLARSTLAAKRSLPVRRLSVPAAWPRLGDTIPARRSGPTCPDPAGLWIEEG